MESSSRPEEQGSLYRDLFEHSHDGVFLLDVTPDMRFVSAGFNPAAERMVGLSNAQVVGRQIEDLLPPDVAKGLVANYQRCVAGGAPMSYWESVQLPSGQRTFSTTLVPIKDDSGRVRRIVGVAHDVTEHAATEQALRASEDLMRLLLDSTSEAIYGIDLQGRCTFANAACLRMLGYRDQSELLGRNMHELMHHTHSDGTPYLVEDCKIYRAGLKDEGTVIDDELLWRADGSSFHSEYRSFPLRRAGRRIGAVVSFIDVTERRKADEAARWLQAIVDASWDAIIGADAQGVITSWSPGAERVYGYTAAEALGRNISLIAPPDRPDEARAMIARLWRGEQVQDFETERVRKDGSSKDVSVSLAFIRSADGAVRGVSGISRDITERKRAEAALHRLSARLLRSEDEARRRLARELHDSTAQLLAALFMNLSAVKEAAGTLDPRARRALADSLALTDACIGEIRTMSYLLHPPELDELGLQSALTGYIRGFSQRSGIRVDLDVPADLGRLPQDMETTVFRVVQECLTNIHRHSGSRTASIRLHRGPLELLLEVRDSGSGMRADAQRGVGIASMQERLQELGGRLEIGSSASGTVLKGLIPLLR